MKTKNFGLIFVLYIIVLLPLISAFSFTPSEINLNSNHNSVVSSSFLINATNKNLTSITYSIGDLIGQSGQPNIASGNLTLSNTVSSLFNSTATININLVVPNYQMAGLYSGKIDITATINGTTNQTLSLPLSLNVSQSQGISVSDVSSTIYRGSNIILKNTISNKGNTNLNNIIFSIDKSKLNDSKGNEINVSFSESGFFLSPGQSKDVNISITVPSSQLIGSYSTPIYVFSNELNSSSTLSLNLDLSYCSAGSIGNNYEIEIKSPSKLSERTWYPYDTINIELKVTKDIDEDKDIIIEYDLYDLTSNEFLEIGDEISYSMDEDEETKTFKFTILLEEDLQTSHIYRLYAKVYEDSKEKSECYQTYKEIIPKKDDKKILPVLISFPKTISCDTPFDVTIKTKNIGKKDVDVKMYISNSDLNLSNTKTFSLDSGESSTDIFTFKIPAGAVEKNYTFEIEYVYGEQENYDKVSIYPFVIYAHSGCKKPISLQFLSSGKAVQGENINLSLSLSNFGSSSRDFTILLLGYETWSELVSLEPVNLTLGPNEQKTISIVLKPKYSGVYSFIVQAISGSDTLQQQVTLDIQGSKNFLDSISKKITDNLIWTIIITVLILAIIILLVIFLKLSKKRKPSSKISDISEIKEVIKKYK